MVKQNLQDKDNEGNKIHVVGIRKTRRLNEMTSVIKKAD